LTYHPIITNFIDLKNQARGFKFSLFWVSLSFKSSQLTVSATSEYNRNIFLTNIFVTFGRCRIVHSYCYYYIANSMVCH